MDRGGKEIKEFKECGEFRGEGWWLFVSNFLNFLSWKLLRYAFDKPSFFELYTNFALLYRGWF